MARLFPLFCLFCALPGAGPSRADDAVPPTPAPRFGDYYGVHAGEGRTDGGDAMSSTGFLSRFQRASVLPRSNALGNFGVQAGVLYTHGFLPEAAGAAHSSMKPGLHMLEMLGADYQGPSLGGRLSGDAGLRMSLYYLVEHDADFSRVSDGRAGSGGDARHSYGAGAVLFAAANVGISSRLGVRVELARFQAGNPRGDGTSLRVAGTWRASRRRARAKTP